MRYGPHRRHRRTSDDQTAYRTVDVDGYKVFYREAGDPAKPALLLLHGFPSSGHMFAT